MNRKGTVGAVHFQSWLEHSSMSSGKRSCRSLKVALTLPVCLAPLEFKWQFRYGAKV